MVFIPRGEAFSQFTVWGEIREKVQFRDGYKELKGSDDKGFLMNAQRTRIGLTYKRNDMGFVVIMEDSRIWGESSENLTQRGFGLSTAYFYINFAKRFTFDIGRRNVFYEDKRLMTDVGWNDYTTAMDAMMFKYRSLNKKTKADVGFSFSNNYKSANFLTAYTVDNMYKYYTWVWASQEFGKRDLVWSLMYINDVNQKENDKKVLYSRSTLGTYFHLFPEKAFRADISLFGQWGSNPIGQQVSAYLASVQLKYSPSSQLEFVLAYDFTSGVNYKKAYGNLNSEYAGTEGASTDFATRAFDRMNGSGHSFFGYLDYFSIRGDGDLSQGAGLQQPYIRIYYKPHKKHSIELSGRYFSLVEPYVVDRSLSQNDVAYKMYQKMPRSLGGEIDLLYKFNVFEDFTVSAGYSFFLPTTTMEKISGIAPGQSRFSQFAYIMLTYKPQIFNSDNYSRRNKEEKITYIHHKVNETGIEENETITKNGL